MTAPGHRLAAAGIHVHRRRDFRCEPPHVVVRNGLPVTKLERSLVDSWGVQSVDHRPAPILFAVAERMTTPARTLASLADSPNLPGRAELVELLTKLDHGCRSPLELWGYDNVFTGPEFERLRWQVPVTVGGRRMILDLYDQATRTNIELDGAAYHSSSKDRERDLRRDALPATIGVQTVRFSHLRLHTEAATVRREVLSIIAGRALEPAMKIGPHDSW